jgi:hypothetical protein
VLNYMLFQPALSAALASACFALMIWPGYAVLHLIGLGRHRWPAAGLAGPAVTLAIWVIVLSGTVWASIPLQRVTGPLWIVTFLSAALGIILRISVRRLIAADRRQIFVWAIALFLALAAMPSTLHYGLGIFASSICQDAWNYIATADFFSHFARGTESAPSPLGQYGSLLMNTRNASSALLAFLSTGLGVSAAEVISLYCLLVLFANSCALMAFAATIFGAFSRIAAFSLLAGFGVPLLIVTYANFDQMLLLPFVPIVAALAAKVGRGDGIIGIGVAIGLLFAVSILTYIEMAIVVLPVAMTFICAPDRTLPFIMRRMLACLLVAIPVTLILTWQGLRSLIAFFLSQYSIAMQAGVRPGDGALSTWLISGDFLRLRWADALLISAFAFAALVASGAWFERKRWVVVLALFGVSGLVFYFLMVEHYIYAVYKIASVNFWLVSFFAVAGADGVLTRIHHQRFSNTYRFISSGVLAFAGLSIFFASVALEVRLRTNALHQEGYREAVTLAGMIGATPAVLSVRDEAANQWAVFYLTKVPLIINPYRSTMGQPEVQPTMNRAKVVDRASVRFVITDHDESIRSHVIGGHLTWDGGTYSLWKLDGGNWSVTAQGGPYNDNVHLSNISGNHESAD